MTDSDPRPIVLITGATGNLGRVPLGAVLMAVPFMFGASPVTTVVTMVLGAGLIVLSIRRGPIRSRYGN